MEILRFLERLYARCGPAVPLTVGDLEYWRYQTDAPESALDTARSWRADGELVGFVWPAPGVLDLAVHPDHERLLDEMLDWGEAGQAGEVAVRGLESDAALTSLLRRRGYERTDDFLHWYRVRAIDGPVAPPAPPPGYSIRAAPEVAEIARLHADAGAGPPIPPGSYRAMRARSPVYRADLDLVAVAPDGAVAAYTLVWFDGRNRFGLFEPVGCHPGHRRRGLASALMREGLARLRALGATHALVACGHGNEPANRLYESLGFRTRDRSWKWVRRDPSVV